MSRLKRASKLKILFLGVIFFHLKAYAVSSGVTYHARILEPDGITPVNGSVQFNLEIHSPGSSNCIMYAETQTLTVTDSKGSFALTIGEGTRYGYQGLTLDKVFANGQDFALSGSTCAGATTYHSLSGDPRELYVWFKSASMSAFEQLPAMELNYAPLAIEAQQIGGYGASSLLKVDSSVVAGASPLNNAQYTELLALLAGTSANYSQASTGSGTSIVSNSGSVTSPAVGSMWLDTTTNTLKFYTSGGTQTISASSSGAFLTSLVSGPGISITLSGSTATVGIGSSGVTSGLLADGSVTAGKIGSGAVSGVNLEAGINIATTGTVTASGVGTRALGLSNSLGTPNTLTLTVPAGAFTNYGLIFPSGQGALGQVLELTNVTTGQLGWTSSSTASLASSNIFVGNTSGVATGVPLTGDVSLSSAGLSTVVGIQGVGVGTTAPSAAGQVLRYDGTSKYQVGFLSMADIRSTSMPGTTIFPTTSCTSSEVLNWSSLTDQFNCTQIVFNASNITGTVPSANLPASASTWAVNSNDIYNSNSGFVGIGTSTPTSELTVAGNTEIFGNLSGYKTYLSDGTASDPALAFSSAQNIGIYRTSSYGLGLATNGTPRVTVDNGGRIGVGTTAPVELLDVAGDANFAGTVTAVGSLIQQIGSAVYPQQMIAAYTSTGNAEQDFARYRGSSTSSPSAVLDGDTISTLGSLAYNGVQIENTSGVVTSVDGLNATGSGNHPGGRIDFVVRGTASTSQYGFGQNALTIRNSGNVGIGTTAPNFALDVVGTVNSSTGFSIEGVPLSASGSNAWSVSGSDVFTTNLSSRVGIGTSVPLDVLSIATTPIASATHSLINLSNNPLAGASSNGTFIGANPVSAAADFLNYEVNGTSKFIVDKDGKITGNGTGLTDVVASSVALSGLSGATSASVIDNLNYAQTWSWSTSSSAAPLTLTADSLTSGGLLRISSASASLNSLNGLLNVANTGTSSLGTIARFQSNSTSGSGLTVTANGRVGLGTTDPANGFDLSTGDGLHLQSGVPFSTAAALYNSAGTLMWNGVALSSGVAGIGGSGTVNTLPYFSASNVLATSPINLASGNVGIGTTAPAFTLDVAGSINSAGAISTTANAAAVWPPYDPSPAHTSATFTTNLSNGAGEVDLINTGSTNGGFKFLQMTGTGAGASLMILTSSGSVGIGTTSPSYKLDVAGQINATAFSIGGVPITSGSANAWALNGLDIFNANTGNVGIGTDTPAYPLTVNGASYYSGNAYFASNVGIGTTNPTDALSVIGNVSVGTGSSFKINGGSLAPSGSGLSLSSVGPLVLSTAATSRVTIDASGNVGIGMTSPQSRLNIAAGSATIAPLMLAAGANLTSPLAGAIEFDGSNLYYTNSSANRLTIATTAGGTTTGSQNFSGAVGIGSTQPSTSTTTGALTVAGGVGVSGTVDANVFAAGNGAQTNPSFTFTADPSSGIWSPAAGALGFSTNSSEKMRITSSGNIGLGTSLPVDTLSFGAITASSTHAMINASNTALAGGNAAGTYIGANPASASADFVNYQVGGVTKFGVDKNGKVTGDGSGLTGVNAGSTSFSGLTAAAGTNTLDNLNNAQTWNWSTASTQTDLSIVGNAITTGSLLSVTSTYAFGNSTGGLLYVANTGAVTNGTIARIQANSNAGSGVTVLANGSVGIGGTAPAAVLQVNSSSVNDPGTLRIQNSSTPNLMLATGVSGTSWGWTLDTGDSNKFKLASGTGLLSTSTARMTVDTSGNVGIGTTSPLATLDIHGAIATDSQSSSAQCINFATSNMQISSYSSSNTVKLGGLVDGGAYSLVLTGYTAGQTVTLLGYTDSACTTALTYGVDFGGSSSTVTSGFVSNGNTQMVNFIYSSARGVAYASASVNFYH